MKKIFITMMITFLSVFSIGCSRDADVVSYNISKDSDNFKILRRIVFYNGITGDYMLSIEGYCSKDNTSTERTLGIVCDTGNGNYKKHLLGLSDNVTFFIEQIDGANVSKSHYKVIFKPSVIIPNIEMR